MKKIAVFPGSFDPITSGHVNIIRKGLRFFDKIIIGIGNNGEKKYMFPLNERVKWIEETFKNEPEIEILSYSGLTVDFCKKNDAKFILRGLRNAPDFEFEKSIAHMNAAMNNEIETVFVLSDLKFSAISSSIVRDIFRNGGNIKNFVPSAVNKK
jgi:pantetheine-phosphate adenylyltransferase